VLGVLGLNRAEQDVYEQLVSCPPMTLAEVTEVAESCGCADDAPQVLARLQELGLVAQRPGDPPRWSAAAPDAALQVLVSEQSRALAEARRYVADLSSRYGRSTPASQDVAATVEVIQGREEIIRRSADQQLRVRRQLRSMDAPPYPAQDATEVNTVEVDHLRRGIRYRILYDRTGLDIPGRLADLEAGIAAGEQARVADVPVKMTIWDDTAAILPLRHPPDVESRLVIHDSVLLDALSALFEMVWDRALPLRVVAGRAELTDRDGLPTQEERQLLVLLVAGLTDRDIAVQLGVSDRTVRSRVHAMMIRLDAATRFQAGYQAVLRGWLGVDEPVIEVADAAAR
jgi:sugar-specific transcriptional regulator TrmB